jgi:arylsulfate sulfotransferase
MAQIMVDFDRTAGSRARWFASIATAVVALALSACGGGGTSTLGASSTSILNTFPGNWSESVEILSSTPGVSPFIQRLTLNVSNLSAVTTVEFTIAPKPTSASKAVDVSYSAAALKARGYMGEGNVLFLPVFGLYAGYTNHITLRLSFQNGSTRTLDTTVTTSDYRDPTGLYQKPTILKQRAPGSSLGFDFFFVKSALGSPIIIDTDGEVRWAAPGVENSMSSAMLGDEFVVGDPDAPIVHRLRMDGTITQNSVTSPAITNFHHNIDYGDSGLLADVNTESSGIQNVETTVSEISDEGTILNE